MDAQLETTFSASFTCKCGYVTKFRPMGYMQLLGLLAFRQAPCLNAPLFLSPISWDMDVTLSMLWLGKARLDYLVKLMP